MKLLLLITAMASLSGCAVNNTKWSDAEKLCDSFGGVKSVLVHQNIAECNHGVYIQQGIKMKFDDNPTSYQNAVLGRQYKALKLSQSAASNVALTVTSGDNVGVTLTLAPGEIHPGPAIITAGTITDVIGYEVS